MNLVELPQRLFADDNRKSVIERNICSSCMLCRRTELESGNLFNEEGLLNASAIRSIDIYDMSTNVILCNEYELDIESNVQDANFILHNREHHIRFISENETNQPPEHPNIKCYKLNKGVVRINVGEIESYSDSYPVRKGQPDEEIFEFNLKVSYTPYLYNIFHCEINVMSNELGDDPTDFNPLPRSKKPNHRKTLATKIRAYFIQNQYFKR